MNRTVSTENNAGAVANAVFADAHRRPFYIGDDRFIALECSEPFLTHHKGPPSYALVICLNYRHRVTEEWLKECIESFRVSDDVFRDEFLSGIIFTGAGKGEELDITTGARELLASLGTVWIDIYTAEGETGPPQGPYLTSGQHLLEIRRLYDDVQGAFVTALIPGPEGEATELHTGGDYTQTINIAVPSRLPGLGGSRKSLSGLRVAVKDIFQVRGIQTSLCNRAYYDLYAPAADTATCIKLLIQAGATIVGTTKLASFAATEEPIECVDFQAPWNPRADGYQSPAGSSSGSGAAIASYSWLDIAIGSDTSGSGRRPGHWNGCFALRPSHGVLPVDGYIPSFRQFDVPTFFGRDLKICRAFADTWYGKMLPPTSALPPSIIYATDYMSLISNQDQLNIIDQFVTDLESSLGVKQRKVSFDYVWDMLPPAEAKGQCLQEYMKDACRNSFFYDDYHSFDQFRGDYLKQFSKSPYVSPPVRWQWELSEKISEAERGIAVERLEVYRNWFSQVVMQVEEYNTIVVLPIENISPRYRDEATSRFNPVGVPMLFLSPISKGPELVVPAGQVPYNSKVSGRTEHLPVAISLLAAPGRDLDLLDLALDCLRNAGRFTTVLAGSKLFPN